MQALSREARSNQRRLLTAFGLENDSDLLKFNQLKVLFVSYWFLVFLLLQSEVMVGFSFSNLLSSEGRSLSLASLPFTTGDYLRSNQSQQMKWLSNTLDR